MKRFALYRGVRGHLVAHPAAGTVVVDQQPQRSGRYVGKRKLTSAQLEAEFGHAPTLAECEMVDRYEDTEEVLELRASDRTLAKAVASGELELVRGPVEARNLTAANEVLRLKSDAPPANPRKVKKTATSGGDKVSDPRPAIRREYVFGAGPSSGLAPDRPVVLWGNKTSAGTETVNAIGDPVVSDADAKTRGGARSEVYDMYRAFNEIPQAATIYYMCPTESASTAAAVVFNVAASSDAITQFEVHAGGHIDTYQTADGDTPQVTAEGIAALLTRMDEGRLLVTTATAIDGAGPDWDLTVTFSQKGARGDTYIGSGSTYGVTITPLTAGNAQTITKGALTAGGTADDWTTAIAAAATDEIYYHVAAKAPVTTVTATDNGIGELMTMLNTQGTKENGKDQCLVFSCLGTNANLIAVTISAAMNSVYAVCAWAEKHQWAPGRVAAHLAGVIRQQEIKHPAANINGWVNDSATGRIWNMPPPQNKADYPTGTEVIAALNNGGTPIDVIGGRSRIVRHITTRSLNSLGNNDYRAREGHIRSVGHFGWSIARQRYESAPLPFADFEPADGQPPVQNTRHPSMVKAMLNGVTDELSSGAPLGQYNGPIFAPSFREEGRAATTVTYDGAGGFPTVWPFQAVQHDLSWSVELRELSDAY